MPKSSKYRLRKRIRGDRLTEIAAWIRRHPDHYRQRALFVQLPCAESFESLLARKGDRFDPEHPPCGTRCCIAGTAMLLQRQPDVTKVERWLGLPPRHSLFDVSLLRKRPRETVVDFLEAVGRNDHVEAKRLAGDDPVALAVLDELFVG